MPSVTALPPSPYAAYLRVYEPLEAFRPEERAAWRRYAEERAVTRSARLAAEHREARRALLGLPPRAVPADESDDAYVLEVEEELLVCPVQSRLRAWLALGAFREGLPDSLLRAFVPPMALRQAYAEHEVWGAKESQPLRIRTVTCMVPMHWFVAFCGRDRRLGTDPAEPSLVYRARMSAARRRVGRALRTLRRTLGEVDYPSRRRSRSVPGGSRSSTRARGSSWTTAGWPASWVPTGCAPTPRRRTSRRRCRLSPRVTRRPRRAGTTCSWSAGPRCGRWSGSTSGGHPSTALPDRFINS